mmetsp:Transcript_2412/g.3231  ORF Transcript_2412/g.3231 Transcript_2412/m.3231 type:complete len:81 (+) Transcript_2412:209-451(+)
MRKRVMSQSKVKNGMFVINSECCSLLQGFSPVLHFINNFLVQMLPNTTGYRVIMTTSTKADVNLVRCVLVEEFSCHIPKW